MGKPSASYAWIGIIPFTHALGASHPIRPPFLAIVVEVEVHSSEVGKVSDAQDISRYVELRYHVNRLSVNGGEA